VPWLTLGKAIQEIDDLLATAVDEADRQLLSSLRAYL